MGRDVGKVLAARAWRRAWAVAVSVDAERSVLILMRRGNVDAGEVRGRVLCCWLGMGLLYWLVATFFDAGCAAGRGACGGVGDTHVGVARCGCGDARAGGAGVGWWLLRVAVAGVLLPDCDGGRGARVARGVAACGLCGRCGRWVLTGWR